MKVLVAYATTYGATQGIAERIAAELTAAGQPATAAAARSVVEVASYEAVVIGSGVYAGRWHKEARAFVRRYGDQWAGKPVWLFSSGPLGEQAQDADGRDLVETSRPLDLALHRELTGARGSAVFFGALDPDRLNLAGRLVRRVPAARAAMPAGDFRDWPAIAAWARGIAQELSVQVPDRRG